MRRTAILVLALALSTPAWAFNTDQLLSTIAMPLAVDAVSRVTGVSQSRLADLVTTLNQANVPPTQFVEVIRYVPVALDQPDFVPYVQTQFSQGVTGDALVNSIVDIIRTKYNVTPTLALNGEPTTVVVREDYIPEVVVTRIGTIQPAGSTDTLTLIALPLAVAAVSDVTGVSLDELANLVATLNNANVPPTQMVQVLRYVPVALTPDNGPQFVQFVQQQTSQGVTGVALVPVVVQQLQTFYPAQTQIVISEPARVTRLRPAPQVVIVDQNYIPAGVVTRMREHPQAVHVEKREREIRTVAPAPVVVMVPRPEKVHKEHKDKGHEGAGPPTPMISSTPARAPAPAPVPAANRPGRDKGDHQEQKGDRGGEHGKDAGKDASKGKGKGHGKD